MHLKPCSSCLRKRQRLKGIIQALSRRKPSAKMLVQCHHGDVTITNDTRKIIAVRSPTIPHSDLLGLETYVAGDWVYDLVKAEPIYRLGRIVKVSNIE